MRDTIFNDDVITLLKADAIAVVTMGYAIYNVNMMRPVKKNSRAATTVKVFIIFPVAIDY